jgi:membrane peptidoglycan carboxypeptidase
VAKLYEQYAIDKWSLADRGYLASVHPLELWMAAYLRQHPGATLSEMTAASEKERQEVYQWLFKTHRKHAQDKRIAGLIEMEGFMEIHKQWKKMGYPFESLVPSYATTLGASADRPASLAEMMGIIVNGGVRKPTRARRPRCTSPPTRRMKPWSRRGTEVRRSKCCRRKWPRPWPRRSAAWCRTVRPSGRRRRLSAPTACPSRWAARRGRATSASTCMAPAAA